MAWVLTTGTCYIIGSLRDIARIYEGHDSDFTYAKVLILMHIHRGNTLLIVHSEVLIISLACSTRESHVSDTLLVTCVPDFASLQSWHLEGIIGTFLWIIRSPIMREENEKSALWMGFRIFFIVFYNTAYRAKQTIGKYLHIFKALYR